MSVIQLSPGTITLEGDIPVPVYLGIFTQSTFIHDVLPIGGFSFFVGSGTISSGLGTDGYVVDAEYYCPGYTCRDQRIPGSAVEVSDQFRTITTSYSLMTDGLNSQYQIFLNLPDGLSPAVPEPATWALLILGFIILRSFIYAKTSLSHYYARYARVSGLR